MRPLAAADLQYFYNPQTDVDTADAKIICYLPLFITSPAQRNETTDGNATYDDAVYVIAAVEIDYNVAVLV